MAEFRRPRTSSGVLWRTCGPARHEGRLDHNVSVYCPRPRVRQKHEDCLDRWGAIGRVDDGVRRRGDASRGEDTEAGLGLL